MAHRLPGDEAHQYRTTDHSEEIMQLRTLAVTKSGTEALAHHVAAEPLKAHDETGIVLDDWDTPRMLVEHLLGKPILPSNV